MNWPVSLTITVTLSYLLGSVPFALLLGKVKGIDIRQAGSRNIGATNLTRLAGRTWGVAAFLLDFLKGLLPVLVTRWLWPWADDDRKSRPGGQRGSSPAEPLMGTRGEKRNLEEYPSDSRAALNSTAGARTQPTSSAIKSFRATPGAQASLHPPITRRVLIFVLGIPRRNLAPLLWKDLQLFRRSTRLPLTFPRWAPLPAAAKDLLDDVVLGG